VGGSVCEESEERSDTDEAEDSEFSDCEELTSEGGSSLDDELDWLDCHGPEDSLDSEE
jgi:hypothetical protein